MKAIDFIEAAIVGILLVLLTVGLGVIVVGIPSFTHYVSDWSDSSTLSGLDRDTALETAEQVRAFVIGGKGDSLPVEVDGRPGFDEKTVSHLEDVRTVVKLVRGGAGVAAALLAVWAAWCLAQARVDALARGMRAGAITTGLLAVLSIGFALVDFDAAFTAFHAVFFESGTWTFTADSLIIQLFPVSFWAAAGAALAAWVLLGVGLMLWGSVAVTRSSGLRSMTTR